MNAPRTHRLYLEAWPAGHVMTFGHAPVSRETAVAFARRFDPQPFHLDEAAARETLWRGLVRSRWTVRKPHDETVMTMAGRGMFLRRHAASAVAVAAAA